MAELNKDYILTIVKEGEQFQLKRQEIVHKYEELLTFLKEQIDNDSYSIFQMEDKFFNSLPLNRQIGYNYLQPYSYWDSYVGGISCPSRISREKYNKELNERETEDSKKGYRKDLKSNFFYSASRYIMAFEYYRTLEELKARQDVKMYSRDSVGWSEFNFNINEDIQVVVWTNFGYGSAAYFTLKIKYKGIDIIPYTHIVEYYYANVFEIIRCTDGYEPIRENWEKVMAFIVGATNTAKVSSDSFINKYIIEECRKMVAQLRDLNCNPKDFYARISSANHADLKLVNVRDIDSYTRSLYEIYPEEVVFTFRCEKVSGALHFLDNLTRQLEYIPEIGQFIDELKLMNRSLIPEIDNRIPKIEKQIEDAELKKQVLENEKADVEKDIEPHKKNIEKLVAEAKKEKEQNKETVYEWRLSSEVKEKYSKEHEDFKELQDKLDDLSKKVSELSREISRRSEFKKMLVKCRELIEEKVMASVA